MAMLHQLAAVSGLEFDSSHLAAQTEEAVAAANALIEESPSLGSLISELERRYDELMKLDEGNLPNGDEIEQELQKYLRKIEGE